MVQTETKSGDDPLIRPMWREDIPLIGSSWLQSMPGSTGSKRRATPIVNMLIGGSGVRLVACDRGDPTQIYGWIIGGLAGDDEPVIAYCYVKYLYRRLGIGTRLAREALKRMGADLDSFRISNSDSRAYLVHSFAGPRSERPVGLGRKNLTPYEQIRNRYRMTYDPHALLVNLGDNCQ